MLIDNVIKQATHIFTNNAIKKLLSKIYAILIYSILIIIKCKFAII